MYISAKVDYALRALLVLTAAAGQPMTGETLAKSQGLPVKFIENTLVELRRGGILSSQRGSDGGYRLARPASQIALGDVFRVLDGPLAEVRGVRPENAVYQAPAANLQQVWVAVRAGLRLVLDSVTLADLLAGELPPEVAALLTAQDAWRPR